MGKAWGCQGAKCNEREIQKYHCCRQPVYEVKSTEAGGMCLKAASNAGSVQARHHDAGKQGQVTEALDSAQQASGAGR